MGALFLNILFFNFRQWTDFVFILWCGPMSSKSLLFYMFLYLSDWHKEWLCFHSHVHGSVTRLHVPCLQTMAQLLDYMMTRSHHHTR